MKYGAYLECNPRNSYLSEKCFEEKSGKKCEQFYAKHILRATSFGDGFPLPSCDYCWTDFDILFWVLHESDELSQS